MAERSSDNDSTRELVSIHSETELKSSAAPPSLADVLPVDMPASRAQAARDIDRIGVEGRPADAKAGPGLLTLELAALLVGVVVLAAAFGAWAGWRLGVIILVVGLLGLAANPVIAATGMRIRDRKQAAEDEMASGRPGSGAGL